MVWWSPQASWSRWASSSTGSVRLREKTRNPVAAAQNPPTIQRTFFIAMTPLFDSAPTSLTMWLVGWMRRSSRAFVEGVRFVAYRGTRVAATLLVWIRFGLVAGLAL